MSKLIGGFFGAETGGLEESSSQQPKFSYEFPNNFRTGPVGLEFLAWHKNEWTLFEVRVTNDLAEFFIDGIKQ